MRPIVAVMRNRSVVANEPPHFGNDHWMFAWRIVIMVALVIVLYVHEMNALAPAERSGHNWSPVLNVSQPPEAHGTAHVLNIPGIIHSVQYCTTVVLVYCPVCDYVQYTERYVVVHRQFSQVLFGDMLD